MKKKKYEKTFSLFLGVFFLLVFELIFLFFLFQKKIQTYKKIQGVVSNNSIILVLNYQDRKKIYSNSFLYVDGKKKYYKIENDLGIILQKDGEDYYQIGIVWDKMNYKNNDSITMSIKDKKIRLIEIFQIILEGD